jgi:hypothetical protein
MTKVITYRWQAWTNKCNMSAAFGPLRYLRGGVGVGVNSAAVRIILFFAVAKGAFNNQAG